MKKIAVALMIACVILAGALPASAGQPVVFADESFIVDENWGSCTWVNSAYDFEILHHGEGWDKVIGYFDRDDNLVQMTQHDSGTDCFYSDKNPDRKLSGHFHFQTHWHLVSVEPEQWDFWYSGVQFNVQVAGSGTVIHQSGLQERLFPPGELLKEVGNTTFDIEELCEALAQ